MGMSDGGDLPGFILTLEARVGLVIDEFSLLFFVICCFFSWP